MDKDGETNAIISSADGWNRLEFHFKKQFAIGDNDLVVATLVVIGSYWDREQGMKSFLKSQLTNDYEVNLFQVVLSKNGLNQLRDSLVLWLENFSAFEVELTTGTDQQLKIFVGERADFISKAERPVFSCVYNTSRMKVEWCFVTDPSCLKILLDDL